MGRKQRAQGWNRYGIDTWRKREIMAFCRQYDKWRQNVAYGLKAIASGEISTTNVPGNPTASQAIKNAILQLNIRAVDDAIAERCPEQIRAAMLDNIARGIPYSMLDVPFSQADFYAIRIAVYARVAEIKEGF